MLLDCGLANLILDPESANTNSTAQEFHRAPLHFKQQTLKVQYEIILVWIIRKWTNFTNRMQRNTFMAN